MRDKWGDRWRRVVFTMVTVVIFLALAVISAVTYNDNQEASDKIKQSNFVIQVEKILDKLDKLFPKTESSIEEAGEQKINKESWSQKIRDYIMISRSKEGLSIILKNSEGEFFNRIWPIFSKQND